MRLYVANCTNQSYQISFRTDFSSPAVPLSIIRPARRQDIPSGRQAPIGGDLTQEQIDHIIKESLVPFGALKVGDTSRQNKAVHLVYDVDKPVSESTIRKVIDYNRGILSRDGELRRKRAAVVVNDIVANTVAQQLAATPVAEDATMNKFEVQVEQEDGEDRIEEGFRVEPDVRPQPPPERRGGRRRAA